ncbi:MAG: hypothetical protein ACREIT_03485, partial [Tepidisphaeraceae bacterium]
ATACVAWVVSPVAAAPTLPDFSLATFVPGAAVDNPYFPLVPGTTRTYTAIVDGEEVILEDTVTFETELVLGVQVVRVRAREIIDGLLHEDTIDKYAQDTAGNVWYFGEETTEFEYDDQGVKIGQSTAGSWKAGVNGASPGFIMPANLPNGFNYFQEFAPNDGAVDQATILSSTESISIPVGDFDNVLKTLEFTELEPGKFEHKLYAPGVGLALIEEDLNELGEPGVVIPLVSVTVIPLPPAALPALGGVLGVVAMTAPWRRVRDRRARQSRASA